MPQPHRILFLLASLIAFYTASNHGNLSLFKRVNATAPPENLNFDQIVESLKQPPPYSYFSVFRKAEGKALHALEGLAKGNDTRALTALANIYFYSQYGIERNITKAREYYEQTVAVSDNADAQVHLSLIYGLGLEVPRSGAKALMYLHLAGDDERASHMLAYKYLHGYGVPQSCEQAQKLYKKLANKAYEKIFSTNPLEGGIHTRKYRFRLADQQGGVYEANLVQKPKSQSDLIPEDDAVEYYTYLASKGDVNSMIWLGRFFYRGGRYFEPDYDTSFKYYHALAEKYHEIANLNKDAIDPGYLRICSVAAGVTGTMYLKGLGVPRNYTLARIWCNRAVSKYSEGGAYNSLGLMYLHGLDVEKDIDAAHQYFKLSSDSGNHIGHTNLAKLYLNQGDLDIASELFQAAINGGSVEALYYIAEIAQARQEKSSCQTSTTYYKAFAEQVEMEYEPIKDAEIAYEKNEKETALMHFILAAEMGHEIAQQNTAFLLDSDKKLLNLPWIGPKRLEYKNDGLAYVYWSRSALAGVPDSLVKTGDYYYKGIGIDADQKKAASCYRDAAESHHNSIAMWNMGWMYENGFGVEQDFHLSKRYYDQTLLHNKDASLPVLLALWKLRIRSLWNAWTGGKANPIGDTVKPTWSLTLGMKDVIRKWKEQPTVTEGTEQIPPQNENDEYTDELEEEEDPVTTIFTIIIMIIIGSFVYYRQVQNQRQQRQRQQQQQQQNRVDENGIENFNDNDFLRPDPLMPIIPH